MKSVAYLTLRPACILCTLLTCRAAALPQQGHAQSATRRDSAGITLVENRGLDRTVSVEPIIRIGSVEGDSATSFSRVRFAARLNEGSIVVADGASLQLRWFGSTGKHLRSFGKRGAGPGEFREMTKLFLDRGDTVVVYDRRNGRVSWVSPAGRLVRSRPATIDGLATVVAVTHNDSMLQVKPEFDWNSLSSGYNYARGRARLLNEAGRELAADLPAVERVLWLRAQTDGAPAASMEMDLPLAQPSLVAAGGDRIVVADPARRGIQIRRLTGELLVVARRQDDPAVAITSQDRARYISLAVERARQRGADAIEAARRDAEARLALLRGARTMPAFDVLLTDVKGRIWVRQFASQYTASTSQLWNIFDIQGVQVARVSLPGAITVMQVIDDYVAGIERDESDVEYIVVYRLRR